MTLTRGTAAACIFAIVLAPATAQAGDLSIDGPIESTLGGFQFPDGTVQTTAASGYTRVVAVAKQGGDFTSIQSAIDSITASGLTRA